MKSQDIQLIDRLLEVTEKEIVPLTQTSVKAGNRIFGAAILRKEDLSLVIASSNMETENPIWHGEVHTLKKFYELPQSKRPAPKDCIFYATHEPCPLCLSAITWAGYDNFYYLFNYFDTRDAFNIPEDLQILKEVFKCDHGQYAHQNYFWKGHYMMDLINSCEVQTGQKFLSRIDHLRTVYSEMSDIYQQSKKYSSAE